MHSTARTAASAESVTSASESVTSVSESDTSESVVTTPADAIVPHLLSAKLAIDALSGQSKLAK